VQGSGASARLVNGAVAKALPRLTTLIREQVAARCPTARTGGPCTWAREELPRKVADSVGGPSFAATVDLLDAIAGDKPARAEVQRLAQYLLTSREGSAGDVSLAAAADLLQWLSDDANLVPFLRAAAPAFGRAQTSDGKVARRSLADAMIQVLASLMLEARDPDGAEICARERDPNHALVAVLGHLMTPADDASAAPFEVLLDVVADVNRAHPEAQGKLDALDYASIAFEVKDFAIDPARGLEQVYEVIREATSP
jgi:hypothetical protein